LLLRQRKRFKVRNQSMQPTASDGDHLLVDTHAYSKAAPQVGDVVIAEHPEKKNLLITKRVAKVHTSTVSLISDNPTAGQDSRHFGALPATALLGRVTAIVR